MASYLHLTPPEFTQLFVAPLPAGREKEFSARGTYTCCLKRQDVEMADGETKSYCCFFFRHPARGGMCAVHEAKPSICKAYSATKCKLREPM
jgi:Fe-S-cluster containining protein